MALAGCGGSGGSGGGGKPVTVAAGKPLAVAATEYRFDPKSVTASAGTLRITLHNGGTQAHDLRIQKDGQNLGGTAIFGPNQSQSAHVKLAPGTYEFICSVGDHASLGMKGTLVVK